MTYPVIAAFDAACDGGSADAEHEAALAMREALEGALAQLEMWVTHAESARRNNCPPDNYMIVTTIEMIKKAKGE